MRTLGHVIGHALTRAEVSDTPAMSRARRSLVIAAEVAALSRMSGEEFETLLWEAREAFRIKTKEMESEWTRNSSQR